MPADTVLRSRTRPYLSAVGLGALADGALYAAVGLAAVAIAGPTVAALVIAANTLGRAGVVLFGGALSDRLGTLQMARWMLVARFATFVAVAFLLQWPHVAAIAAIAAIAGIVDGLYAPAIQGLATHLVEAGQQTSIRGSAMSSSRAASAVGAAVGGGLWSWRPETVGLLGAVLTCACLLALSKVAVSRRQARGASGGMVAEVRASMGTFFGDNVLRAGLGVVAVVNAVTAGPVFVGVPLRANHFGWQGWAAGAAVGGLSAGMVIGAFAMGRWSSRLAGGIGSGVRLLLPAVGGMLVLSFAASPYVAFAAICVLGLSTGAGGSLIIGEMTERVPEGYRGRLMAAITFIATVSVPASHLMYGVLAEVSLVLAGLVMTAALALALGSLVVARH